MAAEGNPTVQMVLPMAEMIGWLRKGVGERIRQAGLPVPDCQMSAVTASDLIPHSGRVIPIRRRHGRLALPFSRAYGQHWFT